MLSWCAPSTAAQSGSPEEMFELLNCTIGAKNGKSAQDVEAKIAVAFSGSLIRKEKIIKTVARHKIQNPENDASLILGAYHSHGVASFNLFDGEFSFALIDQNKKELYIVRSRSGGQDLFWSHHRSALLFSSSLKGILSTGLISATPDLEACASHLFLGYISQDKTPIQGINRVLPGYFLKISFDGNIQIHSFWSFSSYFIKAKTATPTTVQETYLTLHSKINDAVKSRYEKGMPYPAILSGSTGSKIIQEAFLQTTDEPPIPSLIVEFDPLTSPFITPPQGHAIASITPEKFLNSLIPITWCMEVPTADLDALSCWHFSQLCQQHNLSPFFDSGFDAEFANSSSVLLRKAILTELHKWHPSRLKMWAHEKIYSFIELFSCKAAMQFLRRIQKQDPRMAFFEERGNLSHSELLEASPSLGKLFHFDLFFHQFYHLPRIHSEAASLFYLTFKAEVIDKIHTRRFKLAQNFSLQPNAPFVDIELIEFLASLNENIWASPEILSTFPQHYLKAEASPQKVLDLSQWFFHPSIRALFNALKNGLLVESGFITHHFIDKMVRQQSHKSFSILYSLVILELWMRLFIDLPLSHANSEISINELLSIE